MIRAVIVVACVAGCGDLVGFGGDVPALATLQVQATGDLAGVQVPGADPVLQVALVWGARWLTEPLCILPADDADATALIAAGCRDPFSFVPARVAANAPLAADGSATISLFVLPGADVMVGDVTARVAYGSLVIYDDLDGDGTLTLGRPDRLPGSENQPPDDDDGDDDPDDPDPARADRVYAASFVTMTEPDTRLAFREGGFDPGAAFYPRSGCGDPPPSFSLVSAGGFTVAEAIAAQLRGELPREDPATCREVSTDAPVVLTYRRPSELQQVACTERLTDGSVRYRQPPADAPDLTSRTMACVKLPSFGGGPTSPLLQLAISGATDDTCVGLTHYVLRGCRADPLCTRPDWDLTATPPAWWPCAVEAAR
jgi:hypothetical protein